MKALQVKRLFSLIPADMLPTILFSMFLFMTLIVPIASNAANGTWSVIYQNTALRTVTYGISGTTDTTTPPLVVPAKGSTVLMASTIASDSAVVRSRASLATANFGTAGAATAPSATLGGTGTITALNGGSVTIVSENAQMQSVGANVDVSTSGALWSVFYQFISPAPVVR